MKNSYKNAPEFVKGFVDSTIKAEGKYVNDPSDSGGETNYGVTKTSAQGYKDSFKDYNWDGDMQCMPIKFAQDLYVTEYYIKPKFNLIAERDELLAQELFDTGVNTGAKRPSKWLQQLLNVFNNQQKYYADISEDGSIGNGTLVALDAFIAKRGKKGVDILFDALNMMQGSFYIDLAIKREKDEKFIWGWLDNRVDFL